MPTAGEADLAKKKKSNERRTIKKAGPSLSTSSRVSKSAQVKPRTTRSSTKKHEKENIEPNKQRVKAKPAPDFSKLHDKWNNQLQKGKAVSKKTNTKVDPFVLSDVKCNTFSGKKCGSGDLSAEEDKEDFGFEIDYIALQGILNNTGIQAQQDTHPQTRATFAGPQKSASNTITGGPTKRTSIYYTGTKKTNTTPLQPSQSKGLSSNRHFFGFEAKLGKKQVVWAEQDDDDEISFKPDASALESILNNKGIDERQTLAVRHTMGSSRSVPFIQNSKRQSVIDNQQSKRTSIYYTGSKVTKDVSDLPRPSLVGRSHGSVIENASIPLSRKVVTPSVQQYYVPGTTVVGRQDEELEKKDFEVNTFVKPLTPARQETFMNKETKQVSKSIDTRPCTANPLMTPCRGNLDTGTQAPTISASKKQVSWSDILTPHRGQEMDHVKPKEVTPIKSKGQENLISSLKQGHTVDSSLWMSANKPVLSSMQAQSPLDTNTIAMKLFSEDNVKNLQGDKKEKLELEELERQAIEELQLLEVEENWPAKESCSHLDSVTKANQSIDISGCEPLISPPKFFHTPKNLKRPDLTNQLIAATPENHMRITTRNKTPIASSLVRHQAKRAGLVGRTGSLVPVCHTAQTASPLIHTANEKASGVHSVERPGFLTSAYHTPPIPSPVVNHSGQGLISGAHPVERIGRPTPACHTATIPSLEVNNTSEGLIKGAHPIGKTDVLTHAWHNTPIPSVAVNHTGQGMIGGAHPMERTGLLTPAWCNAPIPSLTVKNTGQSLGSGTHPKGRTVMTPPQHIVETPILNASQDTGQSAFHLLSSIKKSTSAIGSKRTQLSSNPSFHKSLSWVDTFCSSTPGIDLAVSSFQDNLINTNNEPSDASCLFTNEFPANVYQSVNMPLAGSHGNNFYETANKPLSGIHVNNPNGRATCMDHSANRLLSVVSGNDNFNNLSCNDGQTLQTAITSHSTHSTFDETNTNISHDAKVKPVQGIGIGNNSSYTTCVINGQETVVSLHNSVYSNQRTFEKAKLLLNQNSGANPAKAFESPGAFNVVGKNRRKLLNHKSLSSIPRLHHPNTLSTGESLSLRSAFEARGYQRRGLSSSNRGMNPTGSRDEGLLGTMTEKIRSSLQSKTVGIHLPSSIKTHSTLTEEALLDTEVTLYSSFGARIKKRCTRDLLNPLAKLFTEGDSQHVVPICECSETDHCPVHPNS